MPRVSKKKQAVDKIFNPDDSGTSGWITREELVGTILELSSNGNSRHGIFFGDNRFIWDKKIKSNKISMIRTIGFSDEHLYGHSRPIREDIRKHHLKTGCVACGSKSSLIIDHKNDLYNDKRVLISETQTIDDFQCLCNACNLIKRQVIKTTKETGKRYGATNIPMLKIFGIDFTKGTEDFDPSDIDAMVGTYWYDPCAFMEYIKKSL